MPNHQLPATFFTDDPLAPRPGGSATATCQRLRQFCAGNQPVVEYLPLGPPCWDD